MHLCAFHTNTGMHPLHATLCMQVDMDAPENADPQQSEDDALMGIQLDTLPLHGLYEALQEKEAQGYAIWVGLWSIAQGMRLSSLMQGLGLEKVQGANESV